MGNKSRAVALMGPPGSGKTEMMCRTAARKPVHVIDIDNKIGSSISLEPLIDSGELSFSPLDVPITDTPLDKVAREYASNTKPSLEPKGWFRFAELVEKLKTDEAAQRAGTWGFDSYTHLSFHARKLIVYQDPRGHATLSDRNYGSYLNLFTETTQRLIELGKRFDKDIIVTVHEKVKDTPTEDTRLVRSTDPSGISRREFSGKMQLNILPSMEGQFAEIMGSFFGEVYQLFVEVDRNGVPTWKCRVHPDGLRPLRTSARLKESEFEPDFRKIWSATSA